MRVRSLWIASTALLVSTCGGGPSTPPPGAGGDAITGSERFGWAQPAADAAELATFRYAFYVDDVRSEAGGVECTAPDASGRFGCSSSLPAMSAGSHTIQIAAFVLDGGAVRESPRSTAVRVIKQ